MKNFNELTTEEINSMSDEDFKNVSPFEKKSCYHCNHLKSGLSWWCTNPDAKKARGTTLPGVIKCPYWAPDWKYIDDKYKTEENGYVKYEGIKEITKETISTFKKIINFLIKK